MELQRQGNVLPPPPGPQEWMTCPAISNCPPGLEYLAVLDQLLIVQKLEVLEIATGFEQKNRFKISNALGQKVFYAAEDSDCCTRMCLGSARPFDMKIMDNFQNEVLHLYRPYRCPIFCCFPSCSNEIEVSLPTGQAIGKVKQVKMWCGDPTFHVKNTLGEVVFSIVMPCCFCKCCSDFNMKIFDAKKKEKIGKVTKLWGGFCKEGFTDADSFRLTFPVELEVQRKALLLAAVFLLDIVYFEH